MTTETRTLVAASELRAVRDAGGKPTKLVGYAARFNSNSTPLPIKKDEPNGRKFVERCAPGMFRSATSDTPTDDPVALFNHDPNMVLGRRSNGTLRLQEDDQGLHWEADLPDAQYARDVAAMVDRGDVKGCSFGFATVRDSWAMQDGVPTRTLQEVRLRDVGPVTFPAYDSTSVDCRSIEAAIAKIDGTEQRATVTVPQQQYSTDSVVYFARDVLQSCRSAFDSCQGLIRMLAPSAGTDVELDAQDMQALADAVDQAMDLVEKIQQLTEACAAAGVVGDDDDDDDMEENAAAAGEMRSRVEAMLSRGLDVPLDVRAALIAAETRAGHMTHGSGPSLNQDAEDAAAALIKAGKVDEGQWSFTAEDEDALLGQAGKEDWGAYAKWFLSIDKNADAKSKAAYKYPYGKAGKVYRAALVAIRSRASKQKLKAVYDAAGRLLDAMGPSTGSGQAQEAKS